MRAQHLPELSLKSETEIRLWKELQRLGERVQIELQSKNVSEDTEFEGFEVHGKTVKVVEEKILLAGEVIAGVEDLRIRPMYVLNLIRAVTEPSNNVR